MECKFNDFKICIHFIKRKLKINKKIKKFCVNFKVKSKFKSVIIEIIYTRQIDKRE